MVSNTLLKHVKSKIPAGPTLRRRHPGSPTHFLNSNHNKRLLYPGSEPPENQARSQTDSYLPWVVKPAHNSQYGGADLSRSTQQPTANHWGGTECDQCDLRGVLVMCHSEETSHSRAVNPKHVAAILQAYHSMIVSVIVWNHLLVSLYWHHSTGWLHYCFQLFSPWHTQGSPWRAICPQYSDCCWHNTYYT